MPVNFPGKDKIGKESEDYIMCTENKKRAILIVIVGIILVATTELSARICPSPPEPVVQVTCCTTFTGEASGGTLIMWDNLGRNGRYVAVETIAGESAEKAIERLAKKIDETNPFDWFGFPLGKQLVTSSGGELKGILGGCGDYMTAGTETGLGIPQPPHSLTANYDPNLKKIALKWINPSPDVYDSIRVRFHWSNYDHSGGDGLVGNSESYVIDLDKLPVNTSDLDILVIGVRNDIPSNAAAIHINNNIQEELYGIPFTAGIAPNWQSWSLDKENAIEPQMGIKSQLARIKGQPYNPIKKPQDKPFYQIINTGDKGGTGGVFRKFIGLTPGNTYRLSARLSILEADPNDKDWSYSLHAIADRLGIKKLTEDQMAGFAPLPNGGSGPQAGRLKVLDSTTRKYEECLSDITLPEDSNSITVWLRLTGKSAIAVGFDWIRLEDLGRKASLSGGVK